MSEPTTAKRGLPLRVKMRHSAHFVDELTSRHETPVGRLLPLSAIDPNPEQPRSQLGDLGDLVPSIREKGILEPILVRPVPPGPREAENSDEVLAARAPSALRYRIIAGERRYRAALEAGLGAYDHAERFYAQAATVAADAAEEADLLERAADASGRAARNDGLRRTP